MIFGRSDQPAGPRFESPPRHHPRSHPEAHDPCQGQGFPLPDAVVPNSGKHRSPSSHSLFNFNENLLTF
jgi:hypothetical protein